MVWGERDIWLSQLVNTVLNDNFKIDFKIGVEFLNVLGPMLPLSSNIFYSNCGYMKQMLHRTSNINTRYTGNKTAD